MAMEQMSVGIISTGGIASTAHAPAVDLSPKTKLTAVMSRDEDRGKIFLDNYGGGTVHTSLTEFVENPSFDLAIICSPDKLHFEQAKACLQAGKHVLLEKPLTLEAEEAEDLLSLAKENQLILATGFHLRSHAGHRKLKEEIDNGAIGDVRHIRSIWAFPQDDDSNWRAHEELTKWWSLSAVGSHCIDLTRWFANDADDWKQFKATIANNIWHGPHDESAVISAQFGSGPTAEIVSSVQFGPYNRIEIFGTEGQAICEATMGREGTGAIYLNGKPFLFEPVNPYVSQLEDVVRCIEAGKLPRADGIVGLRNVEDLLLVSK